MPGGKQKLSGYIIRKIPKCTEFREAMVGGGSVFLKAMETDLAYKYWINDLSYDIYSFWHCMSYANSREFLIGLIKSHFDLFTDVESRHRWYRLHRHSEKDGKLATAVRFFIINRMSFSGTAYSGGFSKSSAMNRYTKSSIERLENLTTLDFVQVTNHDYEEILKYPGEDVHIFLDPPYKSASALYGREGDLHKFNHERLAEALKVCKHSFTVTYDNHPEIYSLYKDWCNIEEIELPYSMGKNKVGKELLIQRIV